MKTKRNRRYWRNLGLFTLICILIGALFLQYVGHPYYLAYGHSHPSSQPVCCTTPAERGLVYEDVMFTTQDGLNLSGWYIPSSNEAAVILLHGIASNRMMMLDLAEVIANHGYGVLLMDLRAHGDSEGNVYPFGGPEAEDVRTAVAYLQQNRDDIDPERIGILGWSLGAQTAIMGAYAEPGIKAIVADGPGATTFSDWPPPKTAEEWYYLPYDFMYYRFLAHHTGVNEPISLKEALAEMEARPILFISSGLPTERHRLEFLFEATKNPKSFWLVPEAGHLGAFRLRPKEYETQVVAFFDDHLLGNSK
jgi:pimeloyl-ACP methyl ester carboxylesterase